MNEEYMDIYAIVFLIALLLIRGHNWLLSSDKPNPFKRSVTDLSLKEKIGFWVALFMGTVLLMLYFTAILVSALISFFIIFTLNGFLATMREGKLLPKFLIDQNFLLTAYLITLTALIFLDWVKEVETYIQKPFLDFVILYAVLIVIIGIFLGIPRKNGDEKRWPDNWRFKAVILLYPFIVGLLMFILVKLTLDIILLIQ
jgi:glucan phosphoethanolaminetransferase (alkaline phosphatase superfamily)